MALFSDVKHDQAHARNQHSRASSPPSVRSKKANENTAINNKCLEAKAEACDRTTLGNTIVKADKQSFGTDTSRPLAQKGTEKGFRSAWTKKLNALLGELLCPMVGAAALLLVSLNGTVFANFGNILIGELHVVMQNVHQHIPHPSRLRLEEVCSILVGIMLGNFIWRFAVVCR